MCGRYAFDEPDELANRFPGSPIPKLVKSNYNAAPSQFMPVITEDELGKKHIQLMQWGIPRMVGKDTVKEIINTRADKAFSPFWKRTVLNHRCLVPATGFYEWKRSKDGKTPFYIHPKHTSLYTFAGIWSTWKNKDGRDVNVYSIMTTEPNKEMRDIHNRMPVILPREDEAAWLEPSNDNPDVLSRLLYPFEDNGLEIYEVSKDVNSPRNNTKKLLAKVST